MAPSIESLCEKTGKQITGRVRMNRDHIFRGGPKYTILSLSGRGMSLVALTLSCKLANFTINIFY